MFGAGKTRAGAAIISGLITIDPTLKIMVLTKENLPSQAFAEHIIALSVPSWIEAKIGRLVGYLALQNHTTSSTRLDVPTANRHEVLRTKQGIIGCGGGFRHECASRYSPVAQWMDSGHCPVATHLHCFVAWRSSSNARRPTQINSCQEVQTKAS